MPEHSMCMWVEMVGTSGHSHVVSKAQRQNIQEKKLAYGNIYDNCFSRLTNTGTHSPPTLLSELGIMASVIQEPKRDPEALTVIGILTAVRRPQPVNKGCMHCVIATKIKNWWNIVNQQCVFTVFDFWFGVIDVAKVFMSSRGLSQLICEIYSN